MAVTNNGTLMNEDGLMSIAQKMLELGVEQFEVDVDAAGATHFSCSFSPVALARQFAHNNGNPVTKQGAPGSPTEQFEGMDLNTLLHSS